jgi:hypothetical protein
MAAGGIARALPRLNHKAFSPFSLAAAHKKELRPLRQANDLNRTVLIVLRHLQLPAFQAGRTRVSP